MKDRRLRSLIALNVVLLVVLALVVMAPGAAVAQSARERPNGQYTIVGGKIQGSTEAAIFVVDAANEELIALGWDSSRRKYTPIGYRSLRRDRENLQKGGR